MQLGALELVVEAKGAVLALLNGHGVLELVGVKSHEVEMVVLLIMLQDVNESLEAKLDGVGVRDCLDVEVDPLVAVEQAVIQEHGFVGRVVNLQGLDQGLAQQRI